MFFPQHILPLLPLYNAQWWGYESLTEIVLVINNVAALIIAANIINARSLFVGAAQKRTVFSS